jgi:hypothetical protein
MVNIYLWGDLFLDRKQSDRIEIIGQTTVGIKTAKGFKFYYAITELGMIINAGCKKYSMIAIVCTLFFMSSVT